MESNLRTIRHTFTNNGGNLNKKCSLLAEPIIFLSKNLPLSIVERFLPDCQNCMEIIKFCRTRFLSDVQESGVRIYLFNPLIKIIENGSCISVGL